MLLEIVDLLLRAVQRDGVVEHRNHRIERAANNKSTANELGDQRDGRKGILMGELTISWS